MSSQVRVCRGRLWSLCRYGTTLHEASRLDLWRWRRRDVEITVTAAEVDAGPDGVLPAVVYSDSSYCYGWTLAALEEFRRAAGRDVWCFARKVAS
jgi:hypothetical protein